MLPMQVIKNLLKLSKTCTYRAAKRMLDNFVVGIATEANGKTILGPDEVAVLTDLGALLCGLYTYWIEKEGGDFLEDEY
jgi:hypothetical protein